MRKTLPALLIALFCLTANAREKIEAANYTLTAVVSAAPVKEARRTGNIPTTPDPRCDHPAPVRPDGTSPMSGRTPPPCGDSLRRLPVYTTFVKLEATIGDTVYTLRGKTMLPPNTYKARIINERKTTRVGDLPVVTERPREVEIFVEDGKGGGKAVKFEIVSKAAAPKP
jgi:hypothetical protein